MLEMFERMGFLLGETAGSGVLVVEDQQYIKGVISYSGGSSGELAVFMARRLARMLAANILGFLDPGQAADDDADDAMREFLNVLCGNILTEMHGVKEVFNLGLGAVAKISANEFISAGKIPGCEAAIVENTPVLLLIKHKIK